MMMRCFVCGKVYVTTCEVMPALRHPEFAGIDQTDTTGKLQKNIGELKANNQPYMCVFNIYIYIYICAPIIQLPCVYNPFTNIHHSFFHFKSPAFRAGRYLGLGDQTAPACRGGIEPWTTKIAFSCRKYVAQNGRYNELVNGG